jgi:tetratricopeptide (TPR) repeat protein
MREEEQGREWMILPLEPKLARRQGMPLKVPVPKEQFEGLAEAGLTGDKLIEWIKDFFETAEVAKDGNWRRRNSEMVSQLEGFVSKQPLWAKAQELFAKNEFDKATQTLKRITVMMPEDHAAKMNYANALANQGQHDKAFKQLKQIRDTFAGEPEYHVTVAQVHVALGDHDAAINECVLALEAKPDHLPAMDALAKLGVLARVYTEPRNAGSLAFVRADALLEFLTGHWDSEPRSVDYYVEQMGYHESENRFDAALEAATRAIAAGGAELVERAELGRVSALRSLGKIDEAIAAAKAYLEKAPKSAAMYVELSSCLRKAGDDAGAAAAVDQALANDPGDQEAICLKHWPDDRGDMMAVSKCLEAIEAHAKAHPEVAGAWRSLARAKLVCGADDEALALFEKAVALAPADDDLRSEWWAELAAKTHYQRIIDDSVKLADLVKRDWKLRWNEAEAYRGLKRLMEARAVYMQINADESLHVDVRKRAKRAAAELGGAPGAPA